MTAHTPGPWKPSGDGVPEVGVYGCGYRVALMTGGEVTRNRANARLIAAAPELLAFITEWLSRQGDDVNYMTEKARAAIAKAKGESDGR